VTVCLLHNEPTSLLSVARLRQSLAEAGAKASPNRAIKSLAQDPKPGELTMGRVKSRESGMEARTI
jgi:hypothetical protein